jgi:predicted dehydrogenase
MTNMPSTTKRFRSVIVGTGAVSAAHIVPLKANPQVDLVAVCDLSMERARAFQQRWGIPQVFQDLREMLDRVSPDVVHVLLPPVAHAAAAEMSLDAGAHVMVEKPFCVSVEECKRIERAAERNGRQACVSHNVTYTPAILQVIELIRSWRLGGIEHVSVVYDMASPGLARGPHSHWMFSAPDKVMLELGPHPLSVIYRLLGRVEQCTALASGEMTLSNGSRFYHTWQSSMKCEQGTAQLLFSLGKAFTSIHVHVIGQDGEVRADLRRNIVQVMGRTRYLRTGSLREGLSLAGSVRKQALRNFRDYALSAVGVRPPGTPHDISIANINAAFYNALAAGRPVLADAREGTAVIEACESITRSALRDAVPSAEVVRG